MKLLKLLKQVILLMILIPVLASCVTVPSEPKNNIVLNFPKFPEPVDDNGNEVVVFEEASNKVEMPLWYFKKITRYVLYVDEAESVYNAYTEAIHKD